MTETLTASQLAERLAAAERQIENLELALANARAIGAAIGIIMASHKLAYDAAFNVLAQASQIANIRVSVLAEHVVLTGALPRLPRATGDASKLTRDQTEDRPA